MKVAHVYEDMDLSPRGRALCDFIFRDGPALGIPDEACLVIGRLLMKQWDGSESLVEIFHRLRRQAHKVASDDDWPDVIEGELR